MSDTIEVRLIPVEFKLSPEFRASGIDMDIEREVARAVADTMAMGLELELSLAAEFGDGRFVTAGRTKTWRTRDGRTVWARGEWR